MRRTLLLLSTMVLALLLAGGVALADSPTTKEDCKNGGYAKYGFKNQGQCIKAVVVEPPPPTDTTAPEIQITQGPAEGSVSSESSFTYTSNEPVQFYCDFRSSSYTGQPTYLGCSDPNDTEHSINFTTSNAEGQELIFYLKAVDAAGNVSEIQRRWTVARSTPVAVASSDPTGHGGAPIENRELIQSFTLAQDTLLHGLDLSLCRSGPETVTTSVQVTLYERTSTGSVQQIAGPREVEWTATGECSSPDVPVDYSAQNIQLEAGHEYGIGVVSEDTAVYWEGGSAYSGGTVYSGTANFSSGTPAYPEGLDVGFKVYGR
jgi:hypothetical protein